MLVQEPPAGTVQAHIEEIAWKDHCRVVAHEAVLRDCAHRGLHCLDMLLHTLHSVH